MGLFSFLKNAGAKLFDRKKDEPEMPTFDPELIKQGKIVKLKQAVTDLGLHVDNLEIDLQDDLVIVHGEAGSQADKEKVVLALGNVEGIASVDDRMTVALPEPEAVFYEVKSGDSLSKIAKAHYGDPMKYPVIFEANKPMLKDPDLIYPGQMLRIPSLVEA